MRQPGARIVSRLRRLAAAALLGIPVPAGALAEGSGGAPDALSERYGAWQVSCAAERQDCVVFQALRRTEDNARLLQVSVFRAPSEDGEPVLRVLTPLGPALSRGVTLAIDEAAPWTLDFLSCWQRGCVAETALTPEIEEALRAGATLAVTIASADTGRALRFDLTLDGFSRGLERFQGL